MYRYDSKTQKVIADETDRGGKNTRRPVGTSGYVGFCKQSDLDALKDTGVIGTTPDIGGLLRVEWPDYDTRKRTTELHPGLLLEADVSPVRRWLIDNEPKIHRPRRCYFDLETDSRVPPRIQVEENQGRILSCAIVDDEGNEWTEVLEEDSNEAEAFLLERAWAKLGQYGQAAAWFGDTFDFPRIKDRARLLNVKAFWDNHRRVLMIDQAAAYKRLNVAAESGEEKTSFKLEAIARKWLGEGKDAFDARKTWEAWEAGGARREEMRLYMLRDAQLLPRLEKATEFLELAQVVCELSGVDSDSHSLKPTTMVDAMMMREAKARETRLPTKVHVEATPYPGAHVFQSDVKETTDKVHVSDFASLYPSIIRSWNLGAETKHGMGAIAPGTGIAFDNETESILSKVVGDGMAARQVWKKKKNALPPGSDEWKQADRMSTAWKVFCNSIYGVMGSPYSRYYDREIVESITLTGQWLIKKVSEECLARGWKIAFGDTDSVGIVGPTVEEYRAFVAWCNSDMFPRLLEECGTNPAFRCVKLSYEKCFAKFIVPMSNDGSPAQKRYAGSYLHYEGTPGLPICPWGTPFDDKLYSRPEVKGLEYKRSDSLRITRRLQEEVITRLLCGEEDIAFWQQWIKSKREAFLNGPIELDDIVLSQGIQKELGDYKSSTGAVRVAQELADRGEDIGIGVRVQYVIVDGDKSPLVCIPAEDYDGTFDRKFYWNAKVYPALLRVLAGALPTMNWKRWLIKNIPMAKRPLPGQLTLL